MTIHTIVLTPELRTRLQFAETIQVEIPDSDEVAELRKRIAELDASSRKIDDVLDFLAEVFGQHVGDFWGFFEQIDPEITSGPGDDPVEYARQMIRKILDNAHSREITGNSAVGDGPIINEGNATTFSIADIGAVLFLKLGNRPGARGNVVGMGGSGTFVEIYLGDPSECLNQATKRVRDLERSGQAVMSAVCVDNVEAVTGMPISIIAVNGGAE